MGQSRLQLVALHIVTQLVTEGNDSPVQHYRVYDFNYIIVLCNTYHCVYFGEFFVHLFLITLGKTARYDYLLVDTVIFTAYCLHYLLDGFFLCTLYKTAGVDNNNIRKTCLVYYLEACFCYLCKHKLSVALVFRTSERYHSDLYRFCHYFSLPFRFPYTLNITVYSSYSSFSSYSS